jgi:hypothetical protein
MATKKKASIRAAPLLGEEVADDRRRDRAEARLPDADERSGEEQVVIAVREAGGHRGQAPEEHTRPHEVAGAASDRPSRP